MIMSQQEYESVQAPAQATLQAALERQAKREQHQHAFEFTLRRAGVLQPNGDIRGWNRHISAAMRDFGHTHTMFERCLCRNGVVA
jgi:hypothetical protein